MSSKTKELIEALMVLALWVAMATILMVLFGFWVGVGIFFSAILLGILVEAGRD